MLEGEIIGPLGDCLSKLSIDHPVLVHIADASGQASVDCQVTSLKVFPRNTVKRCSRLQQVVELGEVLHARLDERLTELSGELQAVDGQLGGKTQHASYYSLREYVHRCSDLLKAGKSRLSEKSEPKLELNASPGARPKRDWESTGSRRQLRDWQAHEDLRAAIKDGRSDTMESNSEERLTREIIDGLTTASVFVEHALAPRSWLVGFADITESSLEHDSRSSIQRQIRHDYEIYGHLAGAHDFLIRLVNCLRHGWQYEVDMDELAHDFWLVSGVALPGILKPLLGTYRSESPGKPSHLSVLRAIPVPADADIEQCDTLLAADNLRGSHGELLTPSEQPMGTHTIRGLIGERVVDFVSGAELELASDDWFRSDKSLERLMDWWVECLPVPSELLEP